MRVVIPQDPFWAELFAAVDEPLLHELNFLAWPLILAPEEQGVVRHAYAAYDRILHQLPPDVLQLVLSQASMRRTATSSREGNLDQRGPVGGTALFRADGRPLTAMHVVDVATDDLVALVTLQRYLMLDNALDCSGIRAALCDIDSWAGQNVVDVYHRALGVLTLIPPPGLVEALTPPRDSDAEVFLSVDAQVAYDNHRDAIVQVISGHNPDVAACHRMLYM